MLVVQLTEELKGAATAVNLVSPGQLKTDLTGHACFMTAEERAELPVNYPLPRRRCLLGYCCKP